MKFSSGSSFDLERDSCGPTMRFRDDNPAELARARVAVAGWRDQNPAGNAKELIEAVGDRFHRDYDVVLRAMLFAVDRHRTRRISGPAFLGRVP